MSRKNVLLAGLALLATTTAQAKPLDAVGISLGTLGNPYFVALTKGATAEAKHVNPNVRIISTSADYDLNKQFSQIDNFIASGVNLILINAVDPQAILPAIKRAQKAGITVIAVDVKAVGANGTVQTDNVEAGRIACESLATKLGGKGHVVIENGPQVSAVTDRVTGCKKALAAHTDITLLSSDQNGQGSRDMGFQVAQGYLVRFPNLNGLFTINDPQAIGSDLAVRQAHRLGIAISSVDGAPDIVAALKDKQSNIISSASQDPYTMGRDAVSLGQSIMEGKTPDGTVKLMMPKLIDRNNVDSYTGWTQH